MYSCTYSKRHQRRLIRQEEDRIRETARSLSRQNEAFPTQQPEGRILCAPRKTTDHYHIPLNEELIYTENENQNSMSCGESDSDSSCESSDSDTEYSFSCSSISSSEYDSSTSSDDSEPEMPRRFRQRKKTKVISREFQNFEEKMKDIDTEDEDEDDSRCHEKDQLFVERVQQVCLKHVNTATHSFVNDMLEVLREFTPAPFPKDARTLLGTPRKIDVEPMEEGEYCHYGVKKAVDKFLNKYVENFPALDTIKLFGFIDGFPVTNSSENSALIIMISEDMSNDVEVVGAYYGPDKPHANSLVRKFVDELIDLINNGFTKDGRRFLVILDGITFDAVAKAYVMCVRKHNAYNGCGVCDIHGEPLKKHVYFRGKGKNLRTDQKFKNGEYLGTFQKESTILKDIPNFGCISGTPIDYMHCVCLGVVKKLLKKWTRGPQKLSKPNQKLLCSKLQDLHGYLPKEFSNRKPKKLKYLLSVWKATDYRQFLLYTGPVVLKNVLKKESYDHFLILHMAISILTNETFCRYEQYLEFAEKLLDNFVQKSFTLYGLSFMSYNTHNLLHLVYFVRIHGPLDNFSAFKFENHIGKAKKLFRKAERPLQQLGRRFGELAHLKVDYVIDDTCKMENEYLDGRHVDKRLYTGSYKKLTTKSFVIDSSSNNNNNVILKDGRVIRSLGFAMTFDNKPFIFGREFPQIMNLYDEQYSSNTFFITVISKKPKKEVNFYALEDVLAKGCVLPFEGNFVSLPIIHTFDRLEKLKVET